MRVYNISLMGTDIVISSRFTGECYLFCFGRHKSPSERSMIAEFREAMEHRRECIRWLKDEANEGRFYKVEYYRSHNGMIVPV